ncbi:MAG: anaerobic ribonucleoside-triphosphate reductase [Elusimicrobiota bacterium]|jgi:hypothetical protein|nr:anaerobic ribonucleoside-triphosphate reductase [Elusimicrobiota bacterium]
MSNQEFLQKLNNQSNNFELINESEKYFVVLNKASQKKYEVKKELLENTDFENLTSVLEGREPIILDGITRIIGYFSKTSNWNKSKIGELKDRRHGNYKVGNCC